MGREPNARRLARHQGRIVEPVQDQRLHELGLPERPPHPHQRFVGKDHGPLGHGVQISAELEAGEGLQERLIEEIEPPQVGDLLLRAGQVPDAIEHGLEPREDGESRLAGQRTKEVLEVDAPLVETAPCVAAGHGEQVEIGE